MNEDSRESIKYAKDIINQLAVIIRTAQIHDVGNVAVVSAIDRFVASINSLLMEYNVLTLELLGEFFYFNETRVRYAMEYLLNFDFLSREFKRRGLGSITFSGRILAEDIKAFLRAFIASPYSQS
ncbi:MAG: hypothetical protein ACK415_02170, partial [Thermodesulfovibrionales bacterium]